MVRGPENPTIGEILASYPFTVQYTLGDDIPIETIKLAKEHVEYNYPLIIGKMFDESFFRHLQLGGFDDIGVRYGILPTHRAVSEIDYRSYLHRGDVIEVEMQDVQPGESSSLTFRRRFRKQEQDVCIFASTYVMLDAQTERPTEMPADMRRALEDYNSQ